MDRTDLTTATGESGPTGHTGDTGDTGDTGACAVVQGSGCGFDDPTTGPCAGTSEAEPGAPPPLDGESSGGGLCGC